MITSIRLTIATAILSFLSGVGTASAAAPGIDVSQQPLFTTTSQPPLNMLVVGRDHKLFYEAYNDAADLNGDGTIDVGYQPTIEYFGYFDSHECYAYNAGVFAAQSITSNKKCGGSAWSGDYLNYLTTSRIDALRKVLYGGTRSTDSTTMTILERAYIPQDAHSWGKEYQSVTRDGYDVHDYTPYTAPATGKYLLFANTTLLSSVTDLRNPDGPPLLRVMQNSPYRIWEWVSIERPVAGDKCLDGGSGPDCLAAGSGAPHGHPNNSTEFQALKDNYARADNHWGNDAVDTIDTVPGSSDNDPGQPNPDNDYLTIVNGTLRISSQGRGNYKFAVDGDDAVELWIDGALQVGWYGGHADCTDNACRDGHATGNINFSGGSSHNIEFRHEEGTGGDNFRLYWKTPSNSTWTIVPKRVSGNSGFDTGVARTFYDMTKPLPGGTATRTDFTVRVEVCNNAYVANETSCKKYTDASGTVVYKPTGLLHDYGENGSMKFGLITGSYMHNRQGGVLRKQMGWFTDEVDPNTGRFTWHGTAFKGIISTLDGLKINSFQGAYEHTYACNNSGWYGPVADGVCRIWGNPIAEMMFETLRYFAGATAPEPEYTYTDAGSDDAKLNMPEVTAWKDPYKTVADGGLGNATCAKPFETVVSDINPSYDSDLPGGLGTDGAPTGSLPGTLSSLNVGSLGGTIWNNEGGGSRSIYIGQVGALSDGAPTAKTASSFGDIRGLSPEEPTKQGSYYSASVAFYGKTNDLSAAANDQKLETFSIAVASPLPRIKFPVGSGGQLTLVPFAKSVAGNSIDPNGAFQSTDQIVDFYVEKLANFGGAATDATINGGRAYAKFRINYEDIEQGNDHDMDAIVSYEVKANADGTVGVTLNSEYAAGSIVQHMGYVISGSTSDGIYLEVRDRDTGASADPRYRLDTPDGFAANGCAQAGSTIPNPACPNGPSLPLNHARTFTAASGAAPAEVLKDPLWFAAKYGGFKDTNNNGIPDEGEWDTKVVGTPDNYFLVTNALGLKAQLQTAFDAIIAAAAPTASVATSTPRFVNGVTLAYEASFNATDWTGDLKAFKIRSDGVYSGSTPVWKASEQLPAAASRNIFTSKPQTGAFIGLGIDFTKAALPGPMQTTLMTGLDTTLYNIDDVLAYLRGDQSKEQSQTPPGPYRTRSSRLGDVLNSSPAVSAVTSYGYGQLLLDVAPTAAAAYSAFIDAKKTVYGPNSENPVVFYGSNDGMLHAIDGSEGSNGGKELFAYVPNAAIDKMGELVRPSYLHRYFVDGSPTISDAYLGGWKTVLLASTGAGSRSVFALDVTNPSAFSAGKVLWEFNSNSADTDAHLIGQDVGRPWMGFADDGNWVAAFGNGYNSEGNNAVLFIRNLANGTKIATIPVPVPASCTATPTGDGCGPNGLATAVLVDNDNSGAGDTIYAGDYLGNLWRFEYNGSSWTLGNGNAPLFVARDANGKRQSITSGVYTVANPLGGTMVIFGSGRYLDTNDADQGQVGVGTRAALDTIYGVLDSRACTAAGSDHKCSTWSTSGAINGRTDLQQQSITSYTPMASDGTGGYRTASRNGVNYRTGGGDKMGWFLDMSFTQGTGANLVDLMLGERVIVRPDGILSDVVVNTIRPQGDSCEPGVQNATMVLDALTGAADFIPVPPPGGYPTGSSPPAGLVGTDTYRGPPQGEPPILIIRPPNPGVPCMPTGLPGDPCDPATPPPGTPTSCSWRSPNSTAHPPGKPMPCGRISWRQLR